LHYKTVTNWRQIISTPKTEYCSSIKVIGKILPFYARNLEAYKKMFPSLNPNCPFQPGPFYVTNYTEYIENTDYQRNNPGLAEFGVILPNGRYRSVITLSTKTDPMVYMIQWQFEIRKRLGEEEFKKK
jgi:hypothetical protein